MTLHQLKLQGAFIRVEELPEVCPWCHALIGLEEQYEGKTYRCPELQGVIRADIIYECPNRACQKLFLAHYFHLEPFSEHKNKSDFHYGKFYELNDVFPKQPRQSKFDESISKLSARFVTTFNEAEAAESYGSGYRKAFEILIKDYFD